MIQQKRTNSAQENGTKITELQNQGKLETKTKCKRQKQEKTA
jgi:hypothetical protein